VNQCLGEISQTSKQTAGPSSSLAAVKQCDVHDDIFTAELPTTSTQNLPDWFHRYSNYLTVLFRSTVFCVTSCCLAFYLHVVCCVRLLSACGCMLNSRISCIITHVITEQQVDKLWNLSSITRKSPILSVMSGGCGLRWLLWHNRIFCGFRSRCTMPFSLNAFSAPADDHNVTHIQYMA